MSRQVRSNTPAASVVLVASCPSSRRCQDWRSAEVEYELNSIPDSVDFNFCLPFKRMLSELV